MGGKHVSQGRWTCRQRMWTSSSGRGQALGSSVTVPCKPRGSCRRVSESYLEGGVSAVGAVAGAYWGPTETCSENGGGGPPQLPAPALALPGLRHLQDMVKESQAGAEPAGKSHEPQGRNQAGQSRAALGQVPETPGTSPGLS